MSIIIDLVIIAIIALCVLIGYYKGLTGSLLKIVSFVLALIIAFIYNLVYNTRGKLLERKHIYNKEVKEKNL